jgi:hypothetical protein
VKRRDVPGTTECTAAKICPTSEGDLRSGDSTMRSECQKHADRPDTSSCAMRNPSPSYSLEMAKAATVWLVGAYIDARVPLAPEMLGLVAGVVKGKPSASSFRKVQEKNEIAYWAAIRFEAGQPADPNGEAPSAATLYAVAKHVREGVGFPQQGTRRRRSEDSGLTLDAAQKSAEATIRGWRKLPHYWQNVLFQRDAGAYFRQMLNPHRPME